MAYDAQIEIPCPHCGQAASHVLRDLMNYGQMTVSCPGCGKEHVVTVAQARTALKKMGRIAGDLMENPNERE
jgi:endogenous inhibitor of DNA gyrase (YacG/DUF329 family)